ncbi:Cellulose synthase (UDP-forming) [Crocosphaera watsonii WH 0401]|uniref:Cellulose synthase (UDP-forming) n=1 Tax=Crocosphaera watsonii WH 0401 TaxID=555881 RepID=T2JFG8_CROWT|nr:Cellulose synthase (UDP-forming) [Crocosphaera watsonii WH 0401]
MVVSLFSDPTTVIDFNIGTYWSLYNALIICVALLAFLDKPKPSIYDSFPLRKKIKILASNQVIYGKTLEISEEGATILVDSHNDIPAEFILQLGRLKIDIYLMEKKQQ